MTRTSLRPTTAGRFSSKTLPTRVGIAAAASSLVFAGIFAIPTSASAAIVPTVGLGVAASYSVLGGSEVTNVPALGTDLSGDLGVSPGTVITGFSPTEGHVHGTTRIPPQSDGAQAANGTAYGDAEGRTGGASVGSAIQGATTKGPGVYKAAAALLLGGTLTLDGQGNRNAVFIFQVPDQLTVESGTHINMIGNAQQCNVFWQVGTTAALSTSIHFVGTIMALASVTIAHATTVAGRALASVGNVTLDDNVFTAPTCQLVAPPTTPAPTAGGPAGAASSSAAVAASSRAAASRAAASKAAALASASRARFAAATLANTGVSPVLKPLTLGAILLLILGSGLLSAGWIRTRYGTRNH
jgi:ice-binding like protein